MKILLTTLHSKYVHASLALPCLAAYCRSAGITTVIEEYTVNEPKEAVLAQIHAHRADVVCFSVYLWNRTATLELVHNLKLIRPGLKVVLGGPEISFESADFFDRHPVDAVICGEGERPLRYLLKSWLETETPEPAAGLMLAGQSSRSDRWLLDSLDEIPSPFAAGLCDLKRGLVYYESSRGCPYNCSFCMSSLDEKVRSFSMERIKSDLRLLIDQGVPLIKFVDRTFNYDNRRARDIFSFLLANNRTSRFHFEIGAHLLDGETLALLEQVPDDMFQFEIGVQSTLPETLGHVGRTASLDRLAANVRQLVEKTGIHLHLDLIAGLPGEDYQHFLHSIDRVYALGGDHLQIEPVKLLPGAPLRRDAGRWGIRFDPRPPYTILSSEQMSFDDLERLRGIGRLFDLVINSGRFGFLVERLVKVSGRLSAVLEDLDGYWRAQRLYRQSRSLRDLYSVFDDYLRQRYAGERLERLREGLARDYAHHERVGSGAVPDFFDVRLSEEEKSAVRQRVKTEVAQLKRSGKVQYFASAFHTLASGRSRQILIFLYVARTGAGLQVRELFL